MGEHRPHDLQTKARAHVWAGRERGRTQLPAAVRSCFQKSNGKSEFYQECGLGSLKVGLLDKGGTVVRGGGQCHSRETIWFALFI